MDESEEAPTPPSAEQVSEAIASLTNIENIVGWRSVETALGLDVLERHVDTRGLSRREFSQLCRVLSGPDIPARQAGRLLSAMVPCETISGEDLMRLARWGMRDLDKKSVISGVLWLVSLCLEYGLVDDTSHLRKLHEQFFNCTRFSSFIEAACSVLVSLTNLKDVTSWRVRELKLSVHKFGNRSCSSALRCLYRLLRPDLDPNCPPPTLAGSAVRNTKLHKRFRALGLDSLRLLDSGIGWEPGQVRGKPVFKDKELTSVLPTAETVNLESGLGAAAAAQQSVSAAAITPLCHVESLEDLMKKFERIDLPNNVLAMLKMPLAPLILSRNNVVERFCFNLYFTLRKEFFNNLGGRKQDKILSRQSKLLKYVINFIGNCYQAIPVVGRFLAEFLEDWDGERHFHSVITLICHIPITDFQELFDTVLVKIENHFFNYISTKQLIILVNYFSLLRFWGTMEYQRYNSKLVGLFADSHSLSSIPLVAIQKLAKYIGELVLRTIVGMKNSDAPSNELIFLSTILFQYTVSQKVFMKADLPLLLQLPSSLAYEAIFSDSLESLAQVCDLLVYQKKIVMPKLKEISSLYKAKKSQMEYRAVYNQIEDDALEEMEAVVQDLRNLFCPGELLVKPGSIFLQDWPTDDKVPTYLFTHRLCFQPFIQNYVAGVPTAEERQAVLWAVANSGLLNATDVLQDSFLPSMSRHQRRDVQERLDALQADLARHLSFLRNFLATFGRSGNVVDDRTETSGVSSMVPKVRNSKGRKAGAEKSRSSNLENIAPSNIIPSKRRLERENNLLSNESKSTMTMDVST